MRDEDRSRLGPDGIFHSIRVEAPRFGIDVDKHGLRADDLDATEVRAEVISGQYDFVASSDLHSTQSQLHSDGSAGTW